MKTSVACMAVCLLFASVLGQPSDRVIDRVVNRIQDIAQQLEDCYAQLATTTPFALSSTTTGFGSETTTADMMETSEGDMSGGMSGGGDSKKRDVDMAQFMNKREGGSVLKQLRSHLRFLKGELDNCMDILD